MDSKIEIAADMLARIGQQRIGLANSERSIVPAALRLGLPVARIAHLTGATVERIEEIRKEVGLGEG